MLHKKHKNPRKNNETQRILPKRTEEPSRRSQFEKTPPRHLRRNRVRCDFATGFQRPPSSRGSTKRLEKPGCRRRFTSCVSRRRTPISRARVVLKFSTNLTRCFDGQRHPERMRRKPTLAPAETMQKPNFWMRGIKYATSLAGSRFKTPGKWRSSDQLTYRASGRSEGRRRIGVLFRLLGGFKSSTETTRAFSRFGRLPNSFAANP